MGQTEKKGSGFTFVLSFILFKKRTILIFDFLTVASISFSCYVSRGKQLTLFPEKTLRFEGKSLTVFQAELPAFK